MPASLPRLRRHILKTFLPHLILVFFSFTATAQMPVTKALGFNPDASINGLFLYKNGNRGNTSDSQDPNGPSLQEAELQFFSDVDPYSKLTALFSVHQESGEWKFEPEEFFAETLSVPGVILKAGKFKAAFGKHNLLHTHAYAFIDAPITNTVLFGDEGLNDVGVSAASLIPVSWFSEVTFQILSGRTEGQDYFNSKSPNDNVAVAHFKNLWDLTDDLTTEIGASGAAGKNEFTVNNQLQSGKTIFTGLDLTFKWRPSVGGKYRALIWSTEYINRQIERPGATKNDGQGIATWLQYQFSERWWAQARGEYLKVTDSDSIDPLPIAPHQRKYSALVGFFPSEFSGFRLQYHYFDDSRVTPEQRLMLQANFTIGAHPAHAY